MQQDRASQVIEDRDSVSASERSRPRLTQPGNPWWLRLAVALIFMLAIVSIWTTNAWLTTRFSENTRVRSELRLALYTGNLLSELQRTAVVPLLLARDPALIGSLNSNDFSTTSARLIAAQKEIGAASIRLLDASGRTVGATDRYQLGSNNVLSPGSGTSDANGTCFILTFKKP